MQLNEHPLLKELAPAVARQMAESAVIRQFAPNEIVFEEGAAPDAIYLILEGRIEFQKKVGGQKYQAVNHNGPGDCFGELGVLQERPRSLRAVAVEASTLARISAESVLHLGREVSGGLLPALLRHVAGQLKTTTEHYLQMALENERRILVGNMVNSIIHDFKSPVGAIRMAVDLIQKSHDDPKTKRMCAIIDSQVDRMLAMANDLLEFSRGQTQLKCARVSVQQIFGEFQTFTEPIFKEHKVELEVKSAMATINGCHVEHQAVTERQKAVF
jgi:CRP-like cAMP-binding protein